MQGSMSITGARGPNYLILTRRWAGGGGVCAEIPGQPFKCAHAPTNLLLHAHIGSLEIPASRVWNPVWARWREL
jgi:hypothetical protein